MTKEEAFAKFAQAPAHVKRSVPLTDAQKARAVDFLMAWVERRLPH